MHFNLYLLHAALVSTAALARPSEISRRTNHELTKRHFWCNGVDTEDICPEGQTMVPKDEYACSAILSAGRMSQISAPADGETGTPCPQQQAPVQKVAGPPACNGSLECTPFPNPPAPVHLTCTEAGGATGSSLLLNCTMAA